MKKQPREYKIISWNIDEIDNSILEFLKDYIYENKPDIVCLQEIKCSAGIAQNYFSKIKGYYYIINSHNPSFYHGVAMLIKGDIKYKRIKIKMNCQVRYDTHAADASCGRVIAVNIDNKFNVLNTYVPNSSIQALKNLGHRVNTWDVCIYKVLKILRTKRPTLWIGDLNVAPYEIDFTKSCKKFPGASPEERASFLSFCNDKEWMDIWRKMHPLDVDYTWQGYDQTKNKMRLDIAVISDDLESSVTSSFIVKECDANTDHLPIGINLTI